jgi:hypothetical protein
LLAYGLLFALAAAAVKVFRVKAARLAARQVG